LHLKECLGNLSEHSGVRPEDSGVKPKYLGRIRASFIHIMLYKGGGLT